MQRSPDRRWNGDQRREPLKGATIHTLLDHRIAMAFSIAALVADGRTKILDSHCIDVSYPGFYDAFEHLL